MLVSIALPSFPVLFISDNPERRTLCFPVYLGIFPVNPHVPHPRPLNLHCGAQQLHLLVRSQWLCPSSHEIDPQLHQPFHICQYRPDSFPRSDVVGRIAHRLRPGCAHVERERDVEVPAQLHAPDRVQSLRQYRVRQGYHALQVKHRERRISVQDRYCFGVDSTTRHHQRQRTPPVLCRRVAMRPVIKIASLDGDAPAAVGPRPCVVRIPAADLTEAGAETHNVRDA